MKDIRKCKCGSKLKVRCNPSPVRHRVCECGERLKTIEIPDVEYKYLKSLK